MDNEVKDLELEELEAAAGGAKPYGYGKPVTVKHIVVRGENLSRLANKYNTSIKSIMKLNPIIKDKNLIVTGWELTIHADDR